MRISPTLLTLVVLSLLTEFSSAKTNSAALVPLPQEMTPGRGAFVLRGGKSHQALHAARQTRILVNSESRSTGEYLAAAIFKSAGIELPVLKDSESSHVAEDIRLTTKGTKSKLGAEGYELSITPGSILIRARSQAGLFYGVQTLLQLLPLTNSSSADECLIPSTRIEDQPRFPWRGCLLDVARHFFKKEQVERLLDLMAQYKLNVLQLHLSDEQGWRINIKQYPLLTERGAWRKDIGWNLDPKSSTAYGPDGRYGGFYSPEDVREIVAYAASRHISIVPEIEMPGHSGAALLCYSNLNCIKPSGSPAPPYGVYCAGNEATFTFLETMLSEIFEQFPGKYVHIGGDEVDLHNWNKCPLCRARMNAEGFTNSLQLETYLIQRIEKFASSRGKTLIGWSEVVNPNMPTNMLVMDWLGKAEQAVHLGHDVVMAPMSCCYLDYYQSLDRSLEPPALGGYIPLWRAYQFEPVPPGLKPESVRHILGGQVNVWTELIPSQDHLDYMIFPRLCAVAEAVWSPAKARNWLDFCRRLEVDEQRLKRQGVHYREEKFIKIGEWKAKSTQPFNLEFDVTRKITASGKYHVVLDAWQGTLKIDSASLWKNDSKISRDEHPGIAANQSQKSVYVLEVPAFKPGARYTVRVAGTAGNEATSAGIVYGQLEP